ncbi:5-formyltetrahydrofolate cyclo-ligase [Chryseobacterium taklimakanense]|uniref:5-formyltetrahydrofolate cyclo-ligase n=1 Tax=Chryseobacterium taklimakanense TaxID=536441 RepID=UPI001E46C830|nr:5-formyltetrahydrofolate cyclo-ligase [Chryseobacterium taklimakanense]
MAFDENTKMEVNSWGIAEPVPDEDAGVTDFDYIITPLLYCDRHGNRVGFGKGYYDGFFAKISGECKKVGVGFYSPNEVVEDLNPHDIPLDYLVTPAEVLSFNGLL